MERFKCLLVPVTGVPKHLEKKSETRQDQMSVLGSAKKKKKKERDNLEHHWMGK